VVDLTAINNDIARSSKELGPSNLSTTKVNVINSCDPAEKSCLDDTNPNGQVDLNTVWVDGAQADSRTLPVQPHLWLYFA
jgi:hypothetical protein